MKYEYGCLVADFAIPDWGKMTRNLIAKEDLYTEEGYGFEDEPHVTILFGIKSDKVKDDNVKAATVPLGRCKTQFTEINCFSGEEYDVVFFHAESPALTLMNMRATALPHETMHREYNAHMTIAYVKPGEGKKYARKVAPFMLIPAQYSYSKPSGDKIFFE